MPSQRFYALLAPHAPAFQQRDDGDIRHRRHAERLEGAQGFGFDLTRGVREFSPPIAMVSDEFLITFMYCPSSGGSAIFSACGSIT